MRLSVTCEVCGEVMRLERSITAPERVWLVCHSCESILRVEVIASALMQPRLVPR